MSMIRKAACVKMLAADESELSLINQYTLRPLQASEVFTFRLAACNNQVDRDYEHFSDATLDGLAGLYPGKSVLLDHAWSSTKQTARIYAAHVETLGEVKQLVLHCYMPRMDTNTGVIAAIEGGILRECSVGVSVARVICDICGTEQITGWCEHTPGKTYDGALCTMTLDEAVDAYEVSFVAVPAQPDAGIVKSKRYGGPEEPAVPPADGEKEKLAHARQELEEKRFGGF